MNSTAKDIADKLNANKVTLSLYGIPADDAGLAQAWGIYYNSVPDNPAECVALIENTNPPPATTLAKEEPIYEVPVQLRVRGLNPETTQALATALVAFLYKLDPFTVTVGSETVSYLGILFGSGFLPLGWDERRRYTHAVNLRIYRRRTAH